MATTQEFADKVCRRMAPFGDVRSRKMFGEYLIYINNKPAIMVCDNTPMVKKLPELLELMQGAPDVYPYEGAKVHLALDIENHALTRQVLEGIDRVTPVSKRKKKPQ